MTKTNHLTLIFNDNNQVALQKHGMLLDCKINFEEILKL